MSDNVFNLPPQEDPTNSLIGPQRLGNELIVEGRLIPNIHVHDNGDTIDFVLDGRMSYEFPREWAYMAAIFASNAMAVGAGFPSIAGERMQEFASECFGISHE